MTSDGKEMEAYREREGEEGEGERGEGKQEQRKTKDVCMSADPSPTEKKRRERRKVEVREMNNYRQPNALFHIVRLSFFFLSSSSVKHLPHPTKI